MQTYIVRHIVGGDVFFTGLVLLALAVVLAGRGGWRRTRYASLCVFSGVLFIAVSATPLPWWLYGLLAIALITWFLLLGRRASPHSSLTAKASETP